MKITCISTVPTSDIAESIRCIKKEFGISIDLSLYYPHQIDHEQVDETVVSDHLKQSDLVLLDIRGEGRAYHLAMAALHDRTNTCLVMMGPFSRLFELTRLGGLSGKSIIDGFGKNAGKKSGKNDRLQGNGFRNHLETQEIRDIDGTIRRILSPGRTPETEKDFDNYQTIIRYWRHGGQENYYNLFTFILNTYFNQSQIPEAKPPQIYPEFGIYHPEAGYFTDLEEYVKVTGFSGNRPIIGIIFSGGMHLGQNMPAVRGLIRSLHDFNIIPVYSNAENTLPAIESYFFKNERPQVDAIINLKWFRINGGPLGGNPALTTTLLKKLNVPVFAPVSMFSQDIDEWEGAPAGINPMMSLISVIWPELDGCIEPIPICGLREVTIDGIDAKNISVIDERLERVTTRIRRWIHLRRIPNAEKRVAILIYNYPPGEGNIGGASYLDVFESLNRLLAALKCQGYTVPIPDENIHELFERNAIVNSGKWFNPEKTYQYSFKYDCNEYADYFKTLHEEVQDDVISRWGEIPGDVMTMKGNFMIPGIELGNIFIGIQPARPPLGEEDIAHAAHDKTSPPHHQYIAYYHWLETEWKADLVFHLGTHGLAEFTKGKEIGMSCRCFPDILIGSMPHLYIYTVVNTSEATIAKRRLYGTMISYNSPPFSTSDLYEKYLELEDLIDEHAEAVRLSQEIRKERIEKKIIELAAELNFNNAGIPSLHEQLYEMKRSIIPLGLHVLGDTYRSEAVKRYLEFVLRFDRNGKASLNRLIAESLGIPYDEAIKHKALYLKTLGDVDKKCSKIIDRLIDESMEAAVTESAFNTEQQQSLKETLMAGLALAREYADNTAETESCIRGLDSEYIEPRVGGDVIRKPDVLPTGTNILQFDPTKIPTQTACERGEEIAKNTIGKYLEEEGRYPERVGIVLWGFETSNSGGETIGQILHYLGVRLVMKPFTFVHELAVIPIEELGRPRIDCHVSICGFFRDMFPNVIQTLNKAFSIVSELDEPSDMNFVRKHTLDNFSYLEEKLNQGVIDIKSAKKLASGRIYGPHAGEYGTRILPLLEDSVWREEKDLAEVYMASMCHLYTDNIHGSATMDLYQKNIASVEIVSKVRDRNDREIIDLDHYFEHIGGLNMAVETVTGRQPMLMISDTTKEMIKTEDIRDVITRGIRTRLLNPKWIDEMLKHDVHGAQQIEERIYNTLGLAATTHSVDNWIWSAIAARYISDDDMRKRLEENNKFAAIQIAERLLEAEQRGYWNASPEEKEKLLEAYLEMEGFVEESL